MAMLAEPRRKQKWSVDPRNSAWSKDESKFGQKMLERMGWSKGKGLGAQEQGSTEHIKVQVKNNTLGLGAAINHEDNWIAHQDDYNQLLAELNDCHGTGGSVSEAPASDSKKSFSLEEKSKSSKKRVHYMKFAKGKDLSSRSDTDLACIFGKREKTKSSQEEADGDSEESEEQEKETLSPPNEAEMGNTVTSSLSVNEYFAKRMAELKKSRSRLGQDSQQNAEVTPADSTEVYSEDPKKKRKKKKRSKNEDNYSDEPELVESTRGDDIMYERKKPKSKKGEDTAHHDITDNTEEQEEEHTQGEKLKKKKKKNKRKKEAIDVSERENDSSIHEDTTTEEPKKKKKKKQK
ncbi:PIN2/TERF1-interacting telomerase inhibitor 1 isoform X1 [Hyperolius riggenbachi]|uniref:PIN2/TERF1-interacting telomerase inhibitor 1 isoform X1 n=1 Tax=Hyperolius riggenbachi TaxID=752182 RepID=UPI0035A31FA7